MSIFVPDARIAQMLCTLFIVGCGGGGGGTTPTPNRVEAITQTFQVQYAARIGSSSDCPKSLESDGFAYAGMVTPCLDAAAGITVDGRPSGISDFPDGSVVNARGSRTLRFDPNVPRESNVATSIDVQRVVVGTIESLDPGHARFSALGQDIQITGTTRLYGDGTITALTVGNRVAVSGFFAANGTVVASAISVDTGNGLVLRGILQTNAGGGYQIGRMAIDFSNAEFDGFAGGAATEGDAVLVFTDAAPVGGSLAADSVQFIGGAWGEGPEDIRLLGGMITQLLSAEMAVEGRAVDCAFFHCADLTEVRLGSLAGVAQSTDDVGTTSGGVVVMEPASYDAYVAGPVDAVDPQNAALTVFGLPIQVSPTAVVSDGTGQASDINEIEIGDTVSVAGDLVADLLVAGRIRTYTDADKPSIAQITTRAATYADPEVRLLQRTFLTDAATAVSESCVGERSVQWLFETVVDFPNALLRIDVPDVTAAQPLVTRVELDTNACGWDY